MKNFKIHPNPNHGIFEVQSIFDKDVNMEVYDAIGKQFYRSITLIKGTNSIDLSNLSKGIYTIVLGEGNNSYFEKIIIK
ncbi:MAG: T9SS type A sorting domain-containing protein [Bacteroidetes bacterium]|nr:T9SS type A sorting domain-containing protein [Bacteroidota bacterium]